MRSDQFFSFKENKRAAMTEVQTVQSYHDKLLKYLAKGKPVISEVESSSFVKVRHYYSVPHEQQESILREGKWFPINLIDVYKDTPDNMLLKDNISFRIRNTTEYSFKSVHKDHNNVLHYLVMTGKINDLQRWLLSKMLFTLKITRYKLQGDDRTWVDFVTIEDAAGQTHYDCVARILGDPPAHCIPRCGTASIAFKGLGMNGLMCDDSFCMQEYALVKKPSYWPEWKSPFPTVSDADRVNALEFAAMVREEELDEFEKAANKVLEVNVHSCTKTSGIN